MGVENYLITSSLVAVLAQRLVRVICKALQGAGGHGAFARRRYVPVFRGAGCASCNGRGYTSRVGIFEMMDVTDDIRKLIMNNADASVLTQAARRNGMRNLREDGWMKIREGVTGVDEVMRVTQEF
jgi:general secretion pathway protein E